MKRVLAITVLMAALLTAVGAGAALAQTAPQGTLDAENLDASPSASTSTGTGLYRADGQTFTTIRSGKLTSAQALLFLRPEQGPPTEPITMEIFEAASGYPRGNVLASTTIPTSAVSATSPAPGSLVTGVFDDPVVVEAGQRYALVLKTRSPIAYGVAVSEEEVGIPWDNNFLVTQHDPFGELGSPGIWSGFGHLNMIYATYVTPSDGTPPETTIDSGPSGIVAGTTANFEFSSSESDSRFRCRLDFNNWSYCTPPTAYPNLSEGHHTFEVKAIDPSGSTDPTPASRTWTVDLTPPPQPTGQPDQDQSSRNSYAHLDQPYSQTFTAGKSGKLDMVSLDIGCCYDGRQRDAETLPAENELIVEVEGTVFTLDPQEFALYDDGSFRWWNIPLDPAPVVRAGQQYRIQVSPSLNGGPYYRWGAATPDAYPGGVLQEFFQGGWVSHSAFDAGFKTYVIPDTTAPKVETVSPANGTKGAARDTNLRSTFSEKVDPASINRSTFKLFKCPSATSTNCTTQVTNAAVAPSADGLGATLDPYGASSTKLGAKTKYKAVVTTGAKDVAGNALDQDPATPGSQQKAWYFTTGSM